VSRKGFSLHGPNISQAAVGGTYKYYEVPRKAQITATANTALIVKCEPFVFRAYFLYLFCVTSINPAMSGRIYVVKCQTTAKF